MDLIAVRGLIIQNLLLSNTSVEELTIVANELRVFDQSSNALRYLASLERASRAA